MGRPLKLQGELLENAKAMLAAGRNRGEVCKELNVSYRQLAAAVGNVWKQKGSTTAPEAAGTTQAVAEVG